MIMIDALTLEQVNAVAAQLYDPEALFFVIVGQPVGLN
jgi:zinc protease